MDRVLRREQQEEPGYGEGARRKRWLSQHGLLHSEHVTGLPPSLLMLFAPRLPLPYLPPIEKKKCPPYTGVAPYLAEFEDTLSVPPPPPILSYEERREMRRNEKKALNEARIEEQLHQWDPQKNENSTSDPYKTLFLARLSYETTDGTLKKEFEQFGDIRKVRIVTDAEGKPRGYAFVEFEHERDMKAAYKNADGRKIDGRRVLVDVERGRTVKGWRPRWLGGGLGSTRLGKKPEAKSFAVGYFDRNRGDDRRHDAGPRSNYSSSRPDDSRHGRKDDRGDRGRRDSRHEPYRRDRDRDYDRDRGRDRDRDYDRDRGRDRDRDRDRDRSRRY